MELDPKHDLAWTFADVCFRPGLLAQFGSIIPFNRISSKYSVDTPRREILKTLVQVFRKVHNVLSHFQPRRFVVNPQGHLHRSIRTLFSYFCRSIRTLFHFHSQARTRVLIFSGVANPVQIVKTPGTPKSICRLMLTKSKEQFK